MFSQLCVCQKRQTQFTDSAHTELEVSNSEAERALVILNRHTQPQLQHVSSFVNRLSFGNGKCFNTLFFTGISREQVNHVAIFHSGSDEMDDTIIKNYQKVFFIIKIISSLPKERPSVKDCTLWREAESWEQFSELENSSEQSPSTAAPDHHANTNSYCGQQRGARKTGN